MTLAGDHAKGMPVATRILSITFMFLLLIALVVLIFPALGFPQSGVTNDVKHDTPGQVVKQGQTVHIDVDLALVNVTVTDPYNRLVAGLEPDNFRVFENSVEQEIQYFSSEDAPTSIGVIFDLSGSMANKVGKAKEAALQFFKTANPQDEFFLVSFNDRAEVVSTFTSSVEDLQSRILSASAKGRTALLDLRGCQRFAYFPKHREMVLFGPDLVVLFSNSGPREMAKCHSWTHQHLNPRKVQ